MVKIITPACNREILQQSVPEAMLYTFEGLPEEEKVLRSMDWADVIVAGPGMGTGQAGALLMEWILKYKGASTPNKPSKGLPLVMDADALNLIAMNEEFWSLAKGREAILTPHPGELMRLLRGS